MKTKLSYLLVLLLCLATAASAANYISKAAAENIALNATGGGKVVQCALESEYMTRVWAVNIFNSSSSMEYDVSINAYTGKILKIVSQPQDNMISKQVAEAAALLVGGKSYPLPVPPTAAPYVLDSKVADQDEGKKGWEVAVQWPDGATSVAVNGEKAVATGLAEQFGKRVISKATAEKLALAAVGGGTILPPTLLEMADRPPHWSVNVTRGAFEYEVWVDAYSGKILRTIRG
jgi:uncharacterized membrane protein YkoI